MERKLAVSAAEADGVAIDLAGLGSRSLAFIIDWKIRTLISSAWMLLAMYGFGLVDDMFDDVKLGSSAALIGYLPALIIYLFYHPVLELISRGRTPGKRIVGIRVADARGGAPTAGATIIRNIFRIVDSAPLFYLVGLGTGIANARGLRLGDIASGTVMVFEDRVSRKTIDKIDATALSAQGLDDDRRLTLDLLERWKSLAVRKRIQIGARVLQKQGVSLDHLSTMSRGEREREIARLLREQTQNASSQNGVVMDQVA